MNDTNENTPESTNSTDCTGPETTGECCGGGAKEASVDCTTDETTEECCGEATAEAGDSDKAGECCGSDNSCSDDA